MKKIYFLICISACLISCGNENYYEDIGIPAKQSKNGDYGIVNLKGELLVDFEIDYKPSIMIENVAHYTNKDAIIFINEKGEEYKSNYTNALHFNEDKALILKENGGLAFIDKTYKTFLTLNNVEEAGNFSEGYFKYKNEEGLWGFMDKDANVKIRPKFSKVNNFSEGLALVSLYNKENEETFIGYINKNGEEVIPLDDKYDKLGNFSNGYATFEEDDKLGYINVEGKEVITSTEWRNAYAFKDNYATIRGDDKEFGLLDNKGKFIIKTREKLPIRFYNDLAIFIGDNRKGGYMDMDRKIVVRPEYDELLPFFSDGAFAKDGSSWLFIDADGSEIESGTNLDIKLLYHENFFESVIINNAAVDNDITLTSKFYDTDGFYEEVLDTKNILISKSFKKLDDFEAVYRIYTEEELFNDKVGNDLSTTIKDYNRVIDSYKIFGKHLSFNNDFDFSVRHNFEDKIMLKDGETRNFNIDNNLTSVTFKIRLKHKAKNNGKKVVERFKELFLEDNFTFNDDTNVYSNTSLGYAVKITRSYNIITLRYSPL